jgi:UDP-3-O-[3-hydroxymyristoyl] N-acetylglucosamine deacetylase
MNDDAVESSIELSGIGLHSGITTKVRLLPDNSGRGIYFVRVDLPEKPIIPARLEFVSQTNLSTELAVREAKIGTIEHLLAALAGCGIDNARIEIDGAEVPLLDGSARLWVDAISSSPLFHPQELLPKSDIKITEPIWARHEDAFVAAIPSSELCFTYGIDFPYAAIGSQWYCWYPRRESFQQAIAPARTFGFAEQIEQLQQAGLIKGGNLDNALVCSHSGWLNPPLRFDNEPVRHKLLDLIGDLSLLGKFPTAHFIAYKASHNLHIRLAKQLLGGMGA